MHSGFRVDQIDHIEMFVPSRYDAASWYERILGLGVIEGYEQWADDPEGPLMISSDGGSTKLALFRGEPPGKGKTKGYHRVAFRVRGEAFLLFLAALDQMQLTDHQQRRVTKEMVADHGRSYSIYFSDPYGHRLEVTTYDHLIVRRSLSAEEC